MLKYLSNLTTFILEHPLARRHKLRAFGNVARWQLASRLLPGPAVMPFANESRLLVERGMTGATGNIYSGLHEFEDMGFVLHFLRPEDLFVDVGANIGSYTVLAAAAVGCWTISFEPVPKTHEWLRLNIAVNGIEARVERRMQALGAHAGTIGFTDDRGPSNRVSLAAAASGPGNRIDVEITTLDDALAGRCPVLMKVDVEGYETAMMAGAAATLANPHLRAIIMEFNGSGVHFGYDENALRQKILEAGFEEFSYSPFERKLVSGHTATADNVIFVRDRAFVEDRLKNAPKFVALGEAV